MTEFLDMGGYAAFVWPSYGIALLVMAGLAVTSVRAWRRNRRLLDQLEQRRRSQRETAGE